ncbi:hypothetical protein GNI_145340, partial [Gregarina niphandrodes]
GSSIASATSLISVIALQLAFHANSYASSVATRADVSRTDLSYNWWKVSSEAEKRNRSSPRRLEITSSR